eukprot:1225573-Karenia_brevis.AAC.1
MGGRTAHSFLRSFGLVPLSAKGVSLVSLLVPPLGTCEEADSDVLCAEGMGIDASNCTPVEV